MLIWKKRSCPMFAFASFIFIQFCKTQIITTADFRPSDIQITPDLAVINSTDKINFTCINYRSNNSILETNLSKIIPTNEIQLFTKKLNESALHIRLESTNYVGVFHLLCYSKGEQSKGNRADIIVIAPPGVLQLAEKCSVYDRQYIKCVIRAPNIARAVQNDYPPKFDFQEIAHSADRLAYRPRFEFLKNESTNENLTFRWQPTVDGEFPNGVRMHMKAMLPHFENSSYFFDMTPIFRITPKFNLQTLSSSKIQMNIEPIVPTPFCEKSKMSNLLSNINQTWTVVDPDQNKSVFTNLIPDSVYRICMKCRQTYTDPDGTEQCQDIRTFSRFHWFFQHQIFLYLMILVFAVFLFVGFIFFLRKKRPSYAKVKHCISRKSSTIFIDSSSDDTVSGTEQDDRRYRSIADIHNVIQQCASPEMLLPI
ncbi:hypothetical protein I4U23_008832 [Adineta vaga]|nr:hypothetical protein I4U23_008832 [Adineta vaga]